MSRSKFLWLIDCLSRKSKIVLSSSIAVPPCDSINKINFSYMDRNEKSLRRFGQLLTKMREHRNLSVRELASLSGIDTRQLSRIEAGNVNIHLTTILALARGLGITPEELLESL
jgi:DNA-binding Xre family transcriptional regulator